MCDSRRSRRDAGEGSPSKSPLPLGPLPRSSRPVEPTLSPGPLPGHSRHVAPAKNTRPPATRMRGMPQGWQHEDLVGPEGKHI